MQWPCPQCGYGKGEPCLIELGIEQRFHQLEGEVQHLRVTVDRLGTRYDETPQGEQYVQDVSDTTLDAMQGKRDTSMQQVYWALYGEGETLQGVDMQGDDSVRVRWKVFTFDMVMLACIAGCVWWLWRHVW